MKTKKFLTFFLCILLGGILVSINCVGNTKQPIYQVKGKLQVANKTLPVDYTKRQMNIRSHIFRMFSGTYLDSMGIVINLLSDSIRHQLSQVTTKDSIAYLKTCLNNTLQDSILLDKLSEISIGEEPIRPDFNGILTAHCKDAATLFVVDSVAMDVFSGSRLIASAISDSFGIAQLHNMPKGNYDIVFSRKAFASLSLKQITVTDEGQLYMDILLKKKGNYIVQLLAENIWISFVVGGGGIIFLLSILILAYYLAKFKTKKRDGVTT